MLRIGLPLALVVVAADQASKAWLVSALATGEVVPVTGFFNLVRTLNTGISFSLFRGADWSAFVFSALAIAISLALVVWLYRARTVWLGAALGLVIGGAAGNTIDRLRLGGVVDFVDLHAFGYHWPAFNVADSAIVGGVVLILAEGLVGRRRSAH